VSYFGTGRGAAERRFFVLGRDVWICFFTLMNQVIRFGIVINQKNVLDRIFMSKKDKQRYLDYAYKVGMKKALQRLI
jgi:hypothetical protein